MTDARGAQRSGAYADSVTLLQVSRTVQGVDGVAAAQVAMATPLNVEVLTEMGFEVPAEATPNDMVVAVRLADGGALETPRWRAWTRPWPSPAAARRGPSEEAPPRTTGSALRRSPSRRARRDRAGLGARCRTPFVEAMDALEAGRDVMVFSDNVPVEQEVALKQARRRAGRCW